MNTWNAPTTNEIAYKRAGGRRRINRQRKAESFWLGIEVWGLGRQGLTIQEIAATLDISPVTAWRHYTKWFGKRRPMIARTRALQQRIAAAEAEYEEQFKMQRKAHPVNRDKLNEML